MTFLVLLLCVLSSLVFSEGACVDGNMMFKGRTGDYLECPSLIDEDPCKCTDTFGPFVMAEECCQSCQNRDLQHCSCRDAISAGNKLSIFDTVASIYVGTYSSCAEAKLAFPDMCEREGVEGGNCCQCCNTACPDTTVQSTDQTTTPLQSTGNMVYTTAKTVYYIPSESSTVISTKQNANMFTTKTLYYSPQESRMSSAIIATRSDANSKPPEYMGSFTREAKTKQDILDTDTAKPKIEESITSSLITANNDAFISSKKPAMEVYSTPNYQELTSLNTDGSTQQHKYTALDDKVLVSTPQTDTSTQIPEVTPQNSRTLTSQQSTVIPETNIQIQTLLLHQSRGGPLLMNTSSLTDNDVTTCADFKNDHVVKFNPIIIEISGRYSEILNGIVITEGNVSCNKENSENFPVLSQSTKLKTNDKGCEPFIFHRCTLQTKTQTMGICTSDYICNMNLSHGANVYIMNPVHRICELIIQ